MISQAFRLSVAEGMSRRVFFWGLVLLCGAPLWSPAAEPPATLYEVTAAQRLALQQIDLLLAEGDAPEVVDLVERTIDEAGGRLIAVPGSQASDEVLVRFVPLSHFLGDRLLRWGTIRPEVLQEYRRRRDRSARQIVAQIRRGQDYRHWRHAVEDVFATSWGDDALLAYADLAIEQRAFWTALGALRRIDPRWQGVADGKLAEEVEGLGWERVLPRIALPELPRWAERVSVLARTGGPWPLGCYHGSDLQQAEVGLRLVLVYRALGEWETAARLAEIIRIVFADERIVWQGTEQGVAEVLKSLPERAASAQFAAADGAHDSQWSTLGRDATRIARGGPLKELGMIPRWRIELPSERSSATASETAIPIGAIGELGRGEDSADGGTRSIPIVHRGRVLAQRGKAIWAFDLQDGTPWPQGIEGQPLFVDAGVDALEVHGVNLPRDGQVWTTLSADQGRVVGRFGPLESGWLPEMRPDRSLSRMVVVDLEAQGAVLDGYPATPHGLGAEEEDRGWEIEGVPLIVEGKLYVGLCRRDQAFVQVSLGCLDLASGRWLYHTPPLLVARPLGLASTSRIGQALVSYREGIVYYHGDCGGVLAIDGENGDLLWSLRYQRAEMEDGGYPRQRRAAQRQSSPPAIVAGMVIVMAADLDRVIAVDAMDGRVLWGTPIGTAAAVDQVLGLLAGKVILGGDQLFWLDAYRGSVVAQWPAGTTSQLQGALPQPRRSGRGLMAGDAIYWPTPGAIWIFDGALPAAGEPIVPIPQRRIDLQAIGVVGGDLIAADGMLLISTGDSIVALGPAAVYNQADAGRRPRGTEQQGSGENR